MKAFSISTTLSPPLFSLSSAHSPGLAYFILTSGIVFLTPTSGIYPNYTLSVPQDSKPLRIINPALTAIDSSAHPIHDPNHNCAFLGAEGAVTHMGPQRAVDVDGPQAQVSVTCFDTGADSASGNATGTVTSATGVSSPLGLPYAMATGSSSWAGGAAAASASGGSGTRSVTAGMGGGTGMPFTGDAVMAAGYAGGAFFAFVLGVVAAAM